DLPGFCRVRGAAGGYGGGETEINPRPRRFGKSKYGVRRFVKGFLDLMTVKFLTGFGQRPQHLLGTIGLLSFSLGFLGLAYLGVTWIINFSYPEHARPFPPLHQRPLMTYALAALLL